MCGGGGGGVGHVGELVHLWLLSSCVGGIHWWGALHPLVLALNLLLPLKALDLIQESQAKLDSIITGRKFTWDPCTGNSPGVQHELSLCRKSIRSATRQISSDVKKGRGGVDGEEVSGKLRPDFIFPLGTVTGRDSQDRGAHHGRRCTAPSGERTTERERSRLLFSLLFQSKYFALAVHLLPPVKHLLDRDDFHKKMI